MAGRYEQKKSLEKDPLEEMFRAMNEPDEQDDDDEKLERLHALHFLRSLLDDIGSESGGAVIEYSNGKRCKSGQGGEMIRVEGTGADVLFGTIQIISCVMVRIDAHVRDDLMVDLFNATKIMMEYKKDRGEE
jgi:hypothetical protein